MLHRPITFDGDRFLCEEKSLKAEKALFASRCEKSLRTSKGRALVSRFRYQWSLATWVEHFRETRDLSSDDEAPAPLPLEEISDAETLELSSDDEGADILLALGNAPPPPVVEVREKPVKKVGVRNWGNWGVIMTGTTRRRQDSTGILPSIGVGIPSCWTRHSPRNSVRVRVITTGRLP